MVVKTVTLPSLTQEKEFRLVANQHTLIMPVGDVHFGAKEFAEHHFKKNIQWGMDRGAWFLGMGDMTEMLASSQKKVFKEFRTSVKKELSSLYLERIQGLLEILSPTKGRWLGMLVGNHSWEFEDGTNTEQLLCRELNCDYLGTMGIIKIQPKKKEHTEASVTILIHHGLTAPRSSGGQLNMIEQLLRGFEADIYLMGHSHGKVSASFDRLYMSQSGEIYHRTKLIARTGSWFKTYAAIKPQDLNLPAIESEGSYGELKAYIPASLGSMAIGIGFEETESGLFRPKIHYSV